MEFQKSGVEERFGRMRVYVQDKKERLLKKLNEDYNYYYEVEGKEGCDG